MRNWNAVVTVRGRAFGQAMQLLRRLGHVEKTGFFNVLEVEAADPDLLLENLREGLSAEPERFSCLARVTPVARTFTFQNPEEFEARAGEALSAFLPRLAGRSFHVRVHRRGFKGQLSSLEEERRLAELLSGALERAGTPGRISFEDSDAVVVVELVGSRAGVSLFTREQLQRYPFLKPD
jgi:tRNA(Ser,Leu) C12 N-acetylase TAN1